MQTRFVQHPARPRMNTSRGDRGEAGEPTGSGPGRALARVRKQLHPKTKPASLEAGTAGERAPVQPQGPTLAPARTDEEGPAAAVGEFLQRQGDIERNASERDGRRLRRRRDLAGGAHARDADGAKIVDCQHEQRLNPGAGQSKIVLLNLVFMLFLILSCRGGCDCGASGHQGPRGWRGKRDPAIGFRPRPFASSRNRRWDSRPRAAAETLRAVTDGNGAAKAASGPLKRCARLSVSLSTARTRNPLLQRCCNGARTKRL
jgi:hypothetical protein